MPWYLDIVSFVVVLIILETFLIKKKTALLKRNYETKDGYQVNTKQLNEFYKYKTFSHYIENPLEKMSNSIESSKSGLSAFGYLFLTVLAYSVIGNGLSLLLSVPNEWIGYLVLIIAIVNEIRTYIPLEKELETWVGQFMIETPKEYSAYGRYVKNPIDVKETIKILEEEKRQLDIATTRRDEYALKRKEFGGRRYPKENLAHLENRVSKHSKEITVLVGKLKKNLLTDNPTGIVEEILQTNQKPSLVSQIKQTPHHIEILQNISSNDGLPDNVRLEAQSLLDSHKEEELDEQKQREIDEALLDINTVKKVIGNT